MDVVTRMDEMRYFRQKIPSARHVPSRLPHPQPPAENLAPVYAAVDGVRSIEDIGRLTGRGEFQTTKDVYALMQSRHAGLRPPRAGGGLRAIVETANEALRLVHGEADAAGLGAEVRASLASFVSGAGVYDILLRGAGPDPAGVFDAERVAENATLVAQGEGAGAVVEQMLLDYIGFAVFSAGSLLGPQREAELGRRVAGITAR
jgi:hypothetical protein